MNVYLLFTNPEQAFCGNELKNGGLDYSEKCIYLFRWSEVTQTHVLSIGNVCSDGLKLFE
jgi:hypothetical protein